MPGLFDNSDGSGLGGILGGLGATLFPGVRQYQLQQQNAAAAQQALGPQGQPGMGQLITTNPNAAGIAIGQRNLEQNYNDLVRNGVPAGLAGLMVTHPEMVTKLGEIQKLGPGEAPYNALSGMLGIGAGPSQQQPPSSQPYGGAANQSIPPSGNQSAIPGMGPTNMAGAIEPAALKNLVDRRLTGDVEAGQEVKAGGISGMNPLNNAAFQKLLTQTMSERGITGVELARRDAQYPAYKKATDTNAQTSTRMQLAQAELGTMLPLLTKAAAATNPTNYPIWNQARLEVMSQTGDPRSAQLASYLNAAVNMWARSITPTNQRASDTDKEHIRAVLSPYWSSGQWEAGARAIMNELNAARAGVIKNQNRIDVQFGFGKDADPNDVNAARSAISRGADKDDVTRRFEEGGFNAPKF